MTTQTQILSAQTLPAQSNTVIGWFDRIAGVAIIGLMLSALPVAALGFMVHSF